MSGEAKLDNGLTQRQVSFFNNMIDQMKRNGEVQPTKAAIDAGYSAKSAHVIASRLLRTEHGQQYLQSLHSESKSSAIASLDWVMDKLTNMANLDIQKDGQPNYQASQCVLKAVAEINKIKGYYAPDKKVNLNMTMDDVDLARAKSLAKKYTREF